MKRVILLFVLLLSISAQAGREAGGGHGIEIENQFYLFDFFEGGIESRPYINLNQADSMQAKKYVSSSIIADENTINATVAKLNEIYMVLPGFAQEVLETLRSYHWRIINPKLIQVRDLGRTVLDSRNGLELKQVAIRDDNQKIISIDKTFWEKMSVSHQVGLIYHEIFYILTNLDNSYSARNFNNFIFHPSFEFADYDTLNERVQTVFKKQYADLETYTELNSTEFKTKCEAFAAKSKSELLTMSQSFSTYYDILSRKSIDAIKKGTEGDKRVSASGTNTDTYKSISTLLEFDHRQYRVPVRNAVLLSKYYVSIHWDTFVFNRDRSTNKVFYTTTSADKSKFTSYATKAANLLQENDSTLYSKCMEHDVVVGLTNFKTLTIQ